jgi:hypothetical protein
MKNFPRETFREVLPRVSGIAMVPKSLPRYGIIDRFQRCHLALPLLGEDLSARASSWRRGQRRECNEPAHAIDK